MKNKILKTLLITSSLLLSLAGVAGAEYIESVDYNFTTNKVEISGKDFESSNGEYAVIVVMKGDKTVDSFVPTTDDASVEKQEQIKIENGTFSLEFPLHNPTDGTVYTAFVKAGGLDVKSSFMYTANITEKYNEIMGKTTAEDFAKAISDNSTRLILDNTVYGELTDVIAAGKIAFAEKASIKNVEDIKAAVVRASYIQALNESKQELVFNGRSFIDDSSLKLTSLNTDAYKQYKSSIIEEGQDFVIENIQGKDYADVEDFLDDFTYQTTIAAICQNIAGGTGHIKTVLAGNNARNEFDLKNYNSDTTNTINNLLLNNKKWDKTTVQEILDTVIKNSSSGGSSSSSGGSSSVGGYGGGYSQNYTVGGTKPTTPETVTFTDLDSVEWARPAIERLAKKGIVSGRGDGIFAPNDNVTRAEFLTMILNTLGLNQPGASCSFSDVTTGDWYYQPVAAGTAIGIAAGYDNGAFGAKDNIIRQDAAVMLNNAIGKVGRTLTAKNEGIEFADSEEISDYAKTAVEMLSKAGIINGSDGKFLPKNNCTRAQAAVMLSGLMDALGMEG